MLVSSLDYRCFCLILVVFIGPKASHGFFRFETVRDPQAGESINLEVIFPSFLPFFNNNGSVRTVNLRRETNGPDQNPMTLSIKLPRISFNPFKIFNAESRESGENQYQSQIQSGSQQRQYQSPTDSRTGVGESNIVISSSDYPNQEPKPAQDLDPVENELYEESVLNQQMNSLDSVLSNQMSQTGPSPATVANTSTFNFPFLPDFSALGQLFTWGRQSARTLAVCNACKVAFGLFMNRARQGSNLDSLMQLATFGCTFFRISSTDMCSGLVSRFGPSLHYIVMQKPTLTAERFCGIALQSAGCTTTDPASFWKIDVNQYNNIPDVPDSGIPGDFAVRKRSIVPDDSGIPKKMPVIKVLHLTDLHVDPDYIPGANADCENEMCCHASDGVPKAGKKAGYYGDMGKCDLPFHSFINALQHISLAHPDIKMMYLTGDFAAHNIWSTSAAGNIEIIANVSRYIHKYFPNVTVIPVLGNHEAHPVNMFSPFGVPAELSTDWLYTATARSWAQWLPKESIHNFLHAGFYDVEIDPYFRVIVLNTNLCYTLNFWQTFEHRDPAGQLRWLTRELQKSEDVGQFVHILGHVPPGQEDCWTVWSKNFYDIINRYSSIVKAQFYGHTHFDEFKLYYQKSNRSKAVVPIWIGASLTPFSNLNPGYKIFTVDGARGRDSTWNVLDHETYIYNLTEANLNPMRPPRWYRLYRATESFGLPDVLPHSLNEFVHRMSANITAFNTFYRYYHKATEVALAEGCDTLCRKTILCNIVTPHYGEKTDCIRLQSEVEGLVLPSSIFLQVTPPDPIAGSGSGSKQSNIDDENPLKRALNFGRSLLNVLGK